MSQVHETESEGLFRKTVRWGARTLALGVIVLGALAWGTTDGFRSLGSNPTGARLERVEANPYYTDGAFKNPVATRQPGGKFLETIWAFATNDAQTTPPAPIPFSKGRGVLAEPPASGLRITWLGHSTMLLEIDGARILTDPIWGERASPSTIVGPARFHEPPYALDELGRIDAVIISHDHYDHLDYPTILELAETAVPFYAPLGVGAHLEMWGVPAERIHELEWWDRIRIPGDHSVDLVSTPSRHFSGRGPTNRNSTLWTSYAIVGPSHRLFFSGDSGITPQFTEIGDKLGPFDVAMMETGAFHPNWGDIHLGPNNAFDAAMMVRAKRVMPVHWGTFQLALHGWDEPVETLTLLAQAADVPLVTPRVGGSVEPTVDDSFDPWWREVR